MAYVKLFSSLMGSTIWCEKPATKILWITMLVTAERSGLVEASIPGLAKLAGISLEECEAGLGVLLAPDKYSRTKEFEGRRIMEVAGGWQVLNYSRYREMKSEEEQREANRRKVAAWRAREKAKREGKTVVPPQKEEVVTPEGEPESSKPEDVTDGVTKVTESNQNVTTVQSTEYKVQSTSSPNGEEGCGGKRASKKKKAPAWKAPFPEDVLEAVEQIMTFWAQAGKDWQPADRATGKRDPVPETSRPKLADRLAAIQGEGGDLKVCVAIAQRFMEDYRRPGTRVWMKAAQYFFGIRDDAPWRALYRAHVTNEQTLELEEVGSNG